MPKEGCMPITELWHCWVILEWKMFYDDFQSPLRVIIIMVMRKFVGNWCGFFVRCAYLCIDVIINSLRCNVSAVFTFRFHGLKLQIRSFTFHVGLLESIIKTVVVIINKIPHDNFSLICWIWRLEHWIICIIFFRFVYVELC